LLLEPGAHEEECEAIRVEFDWGYVSKIAVHSRYVIKTKHIDASGALDVEVANLNFNHFATPEELLREELRRSIPDFSSSTSSERNLGDRNEASCPEIYLDGELSPMSRRPLRSHSSPDVLDIFRLLVDWNHVDCIADNGARTWTSLADALNIDFARPNGISRSARGSTLRRSPRSSWPFTTPTTTSV